MANIRAAVVVWQSRSVRLPSLFRAHIGREGGKVSPHSGFGAVIDLNGYMVRVVRIKLTFGIFV